MEIARCLAIEPAFILLDEPFSGIDQISGVGSAGNYLWAEEEWDRRIDYRPQCA